MKKFSSLVLSTVTALLLIGCGGGSSSSSSNNNTSTNSNITNVPVTKGPLLRATALDQNGKKGVQIENTNIYKFKGDISYPIEVTGGYVDVNNNGVVDAGDYEFTGKLKSYTKVVTPITTYLGNPEDSNYSTKLDSLKELTGATDKELLEKDPSKTNESILSLNAAIYQTYNMLMDNNENNDGESANIQDTQLQTNFTTFKELVTGDDDSAKTFDEKLVKIEEELKNNTDVDELSDLDVKKINFSKEDLVGKKLSVENETYYFRENDVVLDDSGDDYTSILSYGPIENGTVKLVFNDDTGYDLIEIVEGGFKVSYYHKNGSLESINTNSELVDYSQTELEEVLSDIETTSEENSTKYNVSGNTIEISSVVDTATISNGTEALFSMTDDFTWLDEAKFSENLVAIIMHQNHYDGNGFSEEEGEMENITYSSDNLAFNVIENNIKSRTCTNSNTVKVLSVNGISYSDLYRSNMTCVNQVTTEDEHVWDWEWNSSNTLPNNVNGLITKFTDDFIHFSQGNDNFILYEDNKVYITTQEDTATVAGTWESDSDSINLTMEEKYKFNAEISLNSSNQIVITYSTLPGFTTNDYIWTGSETSEFLGAITGILPIP